MPHPCNFCITCCKKQLERTNLNGRIEGWFKQTHYVPTYWYNLFPPSYELCLTLTALGISFGNSAFLVGNRLTLLLGSLWTNLAIPLSTPSFRTHLDDRAAFWPLRRPSLVPTLYFIPFTLYPLLPLSVRHWMLVRIQFAIRSMFVRHWMFVARTHTQFASEVGAPSQRTNDNTDLIH